MLRMKKKPRKGVLTCFWCDKPLTENWEFIKTAYLNKEWWMLVCQRDYEASFRNEWEKVGAPVEEFKIGESFPTRYKNYSITIPKKYQVPEPLVAKKIIEEVEPADFIKSEGEAIQGLVGLAVLLLIIGILINVGAALTLNFSLITVGLILWFISSCLLIVAIHTAGGTLVRISNIMREFQTRKKKKG
jgi:hypothetical protein